MALRIIGIDHGSKEGLVKDCGAESFIDITKFDDNTIREEVKKITGGLGVLSLPAQPRTEHIDRLSDFFDSEEHLSVLVCLRAIWSPSLRPSLRSWWLSRPES